MSAGHRSGGGQVRSHPELPRRRVGSAQPRTAAALPAGPWPAESIWVLFHANPHPAWILDERNHALLAANDVAASRYEHLAGELRGHARGNGSGPQAKKRGLLVDGDGTVLDLAWRRLAFDGRPALLVVGHDVTEQRLLEEELRHQNVADPLTGLRSRAAFEEDMRLLALDGTRPAAVIAIGLDGFRAVNDALGHAGGDLVLCAVAQRLSATAGGRATVARMAGDEFAVLLAGAGTAEACVTAERILVALRNPLDIAGGRVSLSASIGIASSDAPGTAAPALLHEAELASYAVRAAGGGRSQTFVPGMRASVIDRLQLIAELRGATERGEFEVEYQPIIDLGSGLVDGLEALVRWNHRGRGILPPAEFIPLAEQTGLIASIDRHVLATACGQLRRWRRPALAPWPAPHISVNVSAAELRRPDFADSILDLLQAADVHPRELVLEVTETVLVEDLPSSRGRLERLRDAGVRIAMDDFGAGYSSLGYLRSLPVDIVKIDKMFVTDLTTSTAARSLTVAIVTLLRTLGMRTVAEGIETAEQLRCLRALGVDYGQGYHLARPAAADATGRLLTRGRLDLAGGVGGTPPPDDLVGRAVHGVGPHAAQAPVPDDEPIRILIADDAIDARLLLTTMLDHVDGFEVVGEASDGVEAVELAAATQPDVVLLDIAMPRMSGVQALPLLRARCPGVRVVLLSAADESLIASARDSADACVPKGARLSELTAAIRAVRHGAVRPSTAWSIRKDLPLW